MMGGTLHLVSACSTLGQGEERTYNRDLVDLELLYRGEEGLELEARENDDAVTTVCSRVSDDYQCVDVAERQEAHGRLGVYAQFLAALRVMQPQLGGIGNNIAVGYHDRFLLIDSLGFHFLHARGDLGEVHLGMILPEAQKSR